MFREGGVMVVFGGKYWCVIIKMEEEKELRKRENGRSSSCRRRLNW